MTMNKKTIIWTTTPLVIAVLLNETASGSAIGSEYCRYLPVRCVINIFAGGIGGLLVISPAVAAVAGIWFLFSKKRHRLPLVIGWSFLVLEILVLFISGQASIST